MTALVRKLRNWLLLRFYKEEEKNDAFGTAHLAHASTEGVTKFLRPFASSCRRYS
jgi:3-phosphoglycerate kinase